jgi:hypothetical protein
VPSATSVIAYWFDASVSLWLILSVSSATSVPVP